MTPIVEGVTHIAAIVFYAVAFSMGVSALWHAHVWARRVSAVAIMVAAAGWLAFYVAVSDLQFDALPMSVLWSRIFHYNSATMLIIMALMILRASKYGIEYALSGRQDG